MKVLITGCHGQVGHALLGAAKQRGFSTIVPMDRARLDITDKAVVDAEITTLRPDLIINAAAYTAVDQAEDEPKLAASVNVDGAGYLAAAGAGIGAPILHLSTDYVFDGTATSAYTENSQTAPASVYGSSKLAGEYRVADKNTHHCILRTSWVFGDQGNNFVRTMLRLAAERSELTVVADQYGCPTYAGSIASMLLDLAQQYESEKSLPWGTYHYCDDGPTSWHGFASTICSEAVSAGLLQTAPAVVPILSSAFPTKATRPAYSVLATNRFRNTFPNIPIPSWQSGLGQMLANSITNKEPTTTRTPA